MHLRVKKQLIQESLSKIQNIVEKKSIMPILSHLLMEVSEDGIFILATDLETAVKQPIQGDIIETGSICIPARKFYEIVRELYDDIEIMLSEQWVKIVSGRSIFKIACIDAREFPVWPQIGDATKINLSRDILLTAIEKTIYASGEADARYVLNGLLFQIQKNGTLNVVGTDGHRLAHFMINLDDTSSIKGEKRIILSKKSLNELRKFLDDSEHVSIYIGRTHIMCEIDSIVFFSRMIEGNYPEYEKVIPRNNDKIAIVDKNSLITSLKRVSILSKEKQNAVKTEWNKDLLILSSSDPEIGEATDELNVDYQGEPFVIGFNAKYLIEALERITSDKVKITMNEPDTAVYITDVEATSFIYECVVMPLTL